MTLGVRGFQKGEEHYAWKGDEVGYSAVHTWARKQLPEKHTCNKCRAKGKTDLANKSGKYLRDISDWERLCRKCHMISDGRLENSKKTRFQTKLTNKICPICMIEFHPRTSRTLTNSRKCGQALRNYERRKQNQTA